MKISLLNRLFAGALIVAHLMLISCEKNPTAPDDKEAPTVPPASSMTLDLSLFNNTGALGKSSDVAGTPGLYFVTARLTLAWINLLVAVGLSVPVATLAAALSQQPVFNKDDGKFHWIYTVSQDGNTFQADLAGWIDTPNQESVWEMRISATGTNPPLNKFLWYEGRAKLTNASGYWEVYDAQQPNNAIKILRIDWQVPSETQATLQFTVVKPGVPENDDTLTYNVDGSSRSVTLFDNSENATIQIAWDAVTNAGYIIAPRYNNGQKACWDSQLNDVVCP